MPKPKAEACMICAPDPCECFTSKKKAPAARKRPVAEGSLPAQQVAPEPSSVGSGPPRQDLRAKMKAAAAAAPPMPAREQPVARRSAVSEGGLLGGVSRPAPRPVVSDEQLLLNAALRALAPILHEEEKERYRMIINSAPSPSERKAEWKARRSWLLSNS